MKKIYKLRRNPDMLLCSWGVILMCVFGYMFYFGYDASWVQAIGSIFGIFSAIIIIEYQELKNIHTKKIEKIDQIKAILKLILDLYNGNVQIIKQDSLNKMVDLAIGWRQLKDSLEIAKSLEVKEYPSPQYYFQINNFYTSIISYIYCVEDFIDSKNSLSKVPQNGILADIDVLFGKEIYQNPARAEPFYNQEKHIHEVYNSIIKSLDNTK